MESVDTEQSQSKKAKEDYSLCHNVATSQTDAASQTDPSSYTGECESTKEDDETLPRPEHEYTEPVKDNGPPNQSEVSGTNRTKDGEMPSCSSLYDRKGERPDLMSSQNINEEASESRESTLQVNEKLRDKHIDEVKKIKLNELFTEIVAKASINYDQPEIRDIQSAVHEMLERIVTRMNKRKVFNIATIEPCGSMAERMSVWKYFFNQSKQCEELSTEVDFLAVIASSPRTYRNHDCGACVRVSKLPISEKAVNDIDVIEYEKRNTKRKLCEELFSSEINKCLCLDCKCFSIKADNFLCFEYKSTSGTSAEGCNQCAVEMPTGILRVYDTISMHRADPHKCSIVFRWTSKSSTLSACSDKFLQNGGQKISSLRINVDFLPALELFKARQGKAIREHDCFLVPKECKVCKGSNWRKSNYMAEKAYIVEVMSDKHKNCCKVIKYFLENFEPQYTSLEAVRRRTRLAQKSLTALIDENVTHISSYHVKVSILNHSLDCTDTTDDYAECILKVLADLEDAYKTKTLPSFHNVDMNIFPRTYPEFINLCRLILKQAIERLRSVTQNDSCNTLLKGQRKVQT